MISGHISHIEYNHHSYIMAYIMAHIILLQFITPIWIHMACCITCLRFFPTQKSEALSVLSEIPTFGQLGQSTQASVKVSYSADQHHPPVSLKIDFHSNKK